ncbi:MAG: ferrochelatase [Anaerolineae bacterium]
MDKSTPTIGVLVLAYGGPNNLDEIEPYLLDVRGGRPTSPELVAEIREHYRLIGGRSPILELTQAQAGALEVALNNTGDGRTYRTYIGMRHWHPYIKQAVEQITADGIRRVIAIALAPHYSRMSIGAYIKKVEEARAETGADFDITYIESYHLHPLYLQALAERVEDARQRFPSNVRATVPVIFTAHSLPERILQAQDPYPTQLMETAQAVADLVSPVSWRFAYQSAGRSAEPWLGPDAGEVIQELADDGEKNVLIAPVGFVSDHVEILYDIDVEFQQQAEALGMRLERTISLNDNPLFIAALADVVRSRVATEPRTTVK